MRAYVDAHKIALQTFMKDIILEENVLLEVVQGIVDEGSGLEVHSKDQLDGFVQTINNKLDSLDLMFSIRKRKAVEIDQKIYWVLVNTKQDSFSETTTGYPTWCLQAFKTILGQLAQSPYGNLTYADIDAAIRDKKKNATKSDVTTFLERLMKDKWLVEDMSRNGRWTASVRTLVELSEDLVNLGAYEDPNSGYPIIQTPAWRSVNPNVVTPQQEAKKNSGSTKGGSSSEEEGGEEQEGDYDGPQEEVRQTRGKRRKTIKAE
uniref:Non-structural maintenance of chromosomes element 1 homolog n=1 Tax=Mucochytrium quahogii TaxID=96639 RepID=A0A7S2S4C8_9STRA|mmetsp:Transcript_15293/g.24878  ORF Transcript_15293/g.24878 Transcript_15293/m.24878 type:complete len:262 (-) Transcript_15293:1831-2616(-)